ncbi:MAG: hypothetical protein QW551_06635 [Desulfurococcaceae archaeon]
MYLAIAALLTLTILASYIYGLRLFKRTRFYTEIIETYKAIRAPEVVKTKGDIRRVKKYRPLIKNIRRRFILIVLMQTMTFIATYMIILFLAINVANVMGTDLVEVPVSIPFFTIISEDGKLYTSIYIVVLLAFAMSLYFVSKIMRPSIT